MCFGPILQGDRSIDPCSLSRIDLQIGRFGVTNMRFSLERGELAAALRLAARNRWQRGVDNHFSLAVDDDLFLVNPRGYDWSEITASGLLVVNHQGEVVEGDGVVEPSAYFIHSHIHRTVPGARCVLHAHPTYSTALACLDGARLEYCHQDALRFFHRVAYDWDFGGSAFDDDEGSRIARAFGDRKILVMVHHGLTVVGPTVAKAYDDFYFFEAACEYQITAMSTGLPLKRLSEDCCLRLAEGMFEEEQVGHHFRAMRRILDRDQAGYAS
jgi:ribulose-5-phosphate 4-epimerase/fuculose-1-phosphate aldolase